MDYSLLLGVHNCEAEDDPAESGDPRSGDELDDEGWNSIGFISAWNMAPISAQNRPELPFKKDTCINFQFGMFQVSFWAIFAVVVPFLIQ